LPRTTWIRPINDGCANLVHGIVVSVHLATISAAAAAGMVVLQTYAAGVSALKKKGADAKARADAFLLSFVKTRHHPPNG
jgi:hypothetical protein